MNFNSKPFITPLTLAAKWMNAASRLCQPARLRRWGKQPTG
jgi:hypothetical protein